MTGRLKVWNDSSGAWEYLTYGGSNSGTAFPGGPTTGDRFFRTDHGAEFFYDGSRWLCTCIHEYYIPGEESNGVVPLTATQGAANRAAFPNALSGLNVYLQTLHVAFFVSGGTALSGSHKWDLAFNGGDMGAGTGTNFANVAISSGSSSVFRRATPVTLNSERDPDSFATLQVDATKTGTPGDLYTWPTIVYRYVAT